MTKTNDICYLYDAHSGVELIFCENSTISYPLHNHVSVFTIGMVLNGSIVLNTNYSSHAYNKGQAFVIFPYIPHSIKANNSYTLISICIHKNSLLCSHCEIDKIKIKIDITNMLINALGFHKINQTQITLLLDCLNCFGDDAVPVALDTNTRLIDELKQQLELFPESEFSIDEMAHTAFISKYHFIRSFKQAVGLTPHQFQLQNRIRKAQRLITNVDTIAEVASTTGFCDQSHFIKQFEKRVGLTPTIYKRSCGVLNSDSTT